MVQEVTAIHLTGVSCFLFKSSTGCVLLDTGLANQRIVLEKKLKELGCLPDGLKLIILTHGDTDHAGNAAYLREKYQAKIGIHPADAGMVERGDMGWNRKAKPDKVSLIFRIMITVFPIFFKQNRFDVFKTDLAIDENFDLSAYGLDARVIYLPGHSKGSIGILTSGGDLFCGDFIYNSFGFNLIDNMSDHQATVEKLKKLNIKTIYPAHGRPVSIEQFRRKYK